jgi:hypothetical protein
LVFFRRFGAFFEEKSGSSFWKTATKISASLQTFSFLTRSFFSLLCGRAQFTRNSEEVVKVAKP